jgi:hypothetical protein
MNIFVFDDDCNPDPRCVSVNEINYSIFTMAITNSHKNYINPNLNPFNDLESALSILHQ